MSPLVAVLDLRWELFAMPASLCCVPWRESNSWPGLLQCTCAYIQSQDVRPHLQTKKSISTGITSLNLPVVHNFSIVPALIGSVALPHMTSYLNALDISPLRTDKTILRTPLFPIPMGSTRVAPWKEAKHVR